MNPNMVQMFYEFCAYDVCANWGDATEQVCNALGAFMDICYDLGVDVIYFRTNVFCPRMLFNYI